MDNELVRMYNDEGLTLKQIAEKVGSSKSTIQRRLKADGYVFDKITGKYVSNTKEENKEVKNDTDKVINRTYGIPEDIDRALKIKCAIEGKNATHIVREALRNAIEEKYFNIK